MPLQTMVISLLENKENVNEKHSRLLLDYTLLLFTFPIKNRLLYLLVYNLLSTLKKGALSLMYVGKKLLIRDAIRVGTPNTFKELQGTGKIP